MFILSNLINTLAYLFSSKTQQTGKEVPVEVKRSRTGSRTKAKVDDGKEDNGRKVPGKIAPKKKEKEESATKKKEKEEVAPKKKEKEEGGDPKKE